MTFNSQSYTIYMLPDLPERPMTCRMVTERIKQKYSHPDSKRPALHERCVHIILFSAIPALKKQCWLQLPIASNERR